MAIIRLEPGAGIGGAAPSIAPAPPGTMGEAKIGIGQMREVLSIIRELVSTWKEAEPIVRPFIESQRAPVQADMDASVPRVPLGPPRELVHANDVPRAPAAPPASEATAALREEIKLLIPRLQKPTIIEIATKVAPYALTEKWLPTAEAIATHETPIREILETIPEAEMHRAARVLVDKVDASEKELKMARQMLTAVLQRQTPPAPTEPAASEPKKDGDTA